MPYSNHHRSLEAWLRAEERADEAGAEQALGQLFRALPQAPPSEGFAERVLLAAGLTPERLPAPVERFGRSLRAVLALSLLSAGLAAAFLAPAVLGLAHLIRPGEVAAWLVQGISALIQGLADFLAVWEFLAHLRDSLLLVLSTPPVAITLLLSTLLAALAYRGLIELLDPRRSSPHVYA
jgi:hypothetical protein